MIVQNKTTEIIKVKQIVIEKPVEYQVKITSTYLAAQIGITEIGDEAHEVLLLVILDSQNGINAIHRVFQGGLTSSIAYPREIFQSALLNNGAKILLFHNHPSGNLVPSQADLLFTDRVVEAGNILGIELLDHIVVSGCRWYSFKEYCHF